MSLETISTYLPMIEGMQVCCRDQRIVPIEVEGEPANFPVLVHSVDDDLRPARIYRGQAFAVPHFKRKFNLSIDEIYSRRFGVGVRTNCDPR